MRWRIVIEIDNYMNLGRNFLGEFRCGAWSVCYIYSFGVSVKIIAKIDLQISNPILTLDSQIVFL